ncbi:GlxA family transcriptional regulator [Burkholderia multivorans]|uniref:GlxA family transcriptional regulator n=1 Tax=Burkholderia multivorans TaxID=87883 RepID=UPI001C252562|nr:DJ-1/PfpI family protein [Burkholderia multivorans]MBU9598323.1 DJ-1/PfpI family protein [Burkholderia multivorans]MDN7997009.1 DJ-1/PfpI family protein [Burkholderia multivorans]WVN01586.1 DJ-1/PfpI family protein [Burkholderia multivorans]
MAKPIEVHIILYEGFQALDATAALAVFEHTNMLLRRLGSAEYYAVSFVASKMGPVRSSSVVELLATSALDSTGLPDYAIVVGAFGIEDALLAEPRLVSWLMRHGTALRRLASLCTGSYFLAEAGLLDHKRATTHWNNARHMQDRYPLIEVDAEPIYVRQGNLITSAGVTAGIDLALSLVEEDLGRETALQVARDLAVFLKRPGEHSQFSMYLQSQMIANPVMRDLQEWILASLDQPLSLRRLAARASMPPVELDQSFREHAGVSPVEFILTARFELARALLEDPDASVQVVAMRCGFGTVDKMSRAFIERMGVSAETWRARVIRRNATDNAS